MYGLQAAYSNNLSSIAPVFLSIDRTCSVGIFVRVHISFITTDLQCRKAKQKKTVTHLHYSSPPFEANLLGVLHLFEGVVSCVEQEAPGVFRDDGWDCVLDLHHHVRHKQRLRRLIKHPRPPPQKKRRPRFTPKQQGKSVSECFEHGIANILCSSSVGKPG